MPPPRPKQQSGQLTAGSLDDQRSYDDYLEFLNRSPLKKWLPDYSPTSRVVVTVRNEAGERIPEARVQVQRTNRQSPPAELTTGSDGRAVFVAGLDLPYQHEQCSVTVTAPNSQPHVTEMSTEDIEWTIVVPDAPRNLPTRLDLALVIDVTGSMQDELEYLQAEIDGIVSTVKRKYPNITQRFGLIVYRDHGDEFVTRTFDFTESLPEFQANLNRQHAAGGGDYPEAVPEALEQAAKLSWSDHSATRLVFLVADAPPHDRDAKRSFDLVRAMRQKSISLFPVGASGVREEAEYLFRASAFVTQGQYLFFTDHSGVGSPHAKPTAPRYEVERLDQLITRMIAWKLTGDEHQADRILDIDGTAVPPHTSQPPATPQSSTMSPPPAARVAVAHPVPAIQNATRWNSDGVTILWKSCLAIIVISLILGTPIRDGLRSFRKRDRGAPGMPV